MGAPPPLQLHPRHPKLMPNLDRLWSNAHAHSRNAGRILSTWGQLQSTSPRCWPNPSRCWSNLGRHSSNSADVTPKLGQIRPSLAKFGPELTRFDQMWADCGPNSTEIVRCCQPGPSRSRHSPKFVAAQMARRSACMLDEGPWILAPQLPGTRSRVDSRPSSASNMKRLTLARYRLKMTRVGACWADVRRVRQNVLGVGQHGPHVGLFGAGLVQTWGNIDSHRPHVCDPATTNFRPISFECSPMWTSVGLAGFRADLGHPGRWDDNYLGTWMEQRNVEGGHRCGQAGCVKKCAAAIGMRSPQWRCLRCSCFSIADSACVV